MSVQVSRMLRSEPAIILIFALLAVLFSLPVYAHLGYWGGTGWDVFLQRSSVSRASVLKYGQFPLWNPYVMGGMPHLAHPESNVLSLPFLVELVFGVILGCKINITLHLFIGLWGAYSLARHYQQGALAAMLTAFVFMFSSMYALTLTSGLVTGYAIGYMPWALLFFLKAMEEFVWVFAAALLLTLMWLAGGVYPFCVTLLFLGTYTLIGLTLREWGIVKATAILGSIVVLTFLLGAVKFLPAIELTRQYPRHLDSYAGISLEAMFHGLFGRNQSIAAAIGMSDARGFLRGLSWGGIHETGMYIGYLPFLFFMVGCFWGPRKYRVLLLCVCILVWLGMGDRCQPLSLWALVHKIPPYSIMRTAERFRYAFMLGLAVLAGAGLQALSDFLSRRFPCSEWPRWTVAGGVALVLVDLFTVNSPIFRDAFPIPPIKVEASESFYQFPGSYEYDQYGFVVNRPGDQLYKSLGASFPAFLANAGTISADETMPVPDKALPTTSPEYRGEVHLEGATGRASYRFWSPNRLLVEVDSAVPATLVINQNYYPGWRVSGGLRSESSKGLLAVRVDPGVRLVEFYYRPTSFVVGAIVSLVTFAGMGGWGWGLRRRSMVAAGRDMAR